MKGPRIYDASFVRRERPAVRLEATPRRGDFRNPTRRPYTARTGHQHFTEGWMRSQKGFKDVSHKICRRLNTLHLGVLLALYMSACGIVQPRPVRPRLGPDRPTCGGCDPGLLANRSEGGAVEPGATTKSKPPGPKMSLTGRWSGDRFFVGVMSATTLVMMLPRIMNSTSDSQHSCGGGPVPRVRLTSIATRDRGSRLTVMRRSGLESEGLLYA
jgi:hypothetical protein